MSPTALIVTEAPSVGGAEVGAAAPTDGVDVAVGVAVGVEVMVALDGKAGARTVETMVASGTPAFFAQPDASTMTTQSTTNGATRRQGRGLKARAPKLSAETSMRPF